jgi:hypothetical protein
MSCLQSSRQIPGSCEIAFGTVPFDPAKFARESHSTKRLADPRTGRRGRPAGRGGPAACPPQQLEGIVDRLIDLYWIKDRF